MNALNDFESLLNESLAKHSLKPGSIVPGRVTRIDSKFVLIDVGLKSEGVVPVSEFTAIDGSISVKVGDTVDVSVDAISDDFGETRLSREKAKRAQVWNALVQANEKGETVKGRIVGKVKGGFAVDLEDVRAFLPGSLVDTHSAADTASFEGSIVDVKVIKIDSERNNVVVSRRAVIEESHQVQRGDFLKTLHEGQIVQGKVKNMTEYGAFVEVFREDGVGSGVDGLLHIRDISWQRVRPAEFVSIGDMVTVVVLKVDLETGRISLGRKQLSEDPWVNGLGEFPVGTSCKGKVVNIMEYGCFVEVAPGIEGLVHSSELGWESKNLIPSKFAKVGDEVDVKVLEIDTERRRISLSIKQCKSNPWIAFAEAHQVGEVLKGAVKSVTEFGIFVALGGLIDGLVHLSDISWTEPGEQAVHHYKKGDEIQVIVMSIDPEKERISLGIKQLQNDPFGNFASAHPRGTVVQGAVTEVERSHAFVSLAPEIKGRIKVADYGDGKVEDLTQQLKVGDALEARVSGIGYRDRLVYLSTRPVAEDEEVKAVQPKPEPKKVARPKPVIIDTSLGSVFREHFAAQEEREERREE